MTPEEIAYDILEDDLATMFDSPPMTPRNIFPDVPNFSLGMKNFQSSQQDVYETPTTQTLPTIADTTSPGDFIPQNYKCSFYMEVSISLCDTSHNVSQIMSLYDITHQTVISVVFIRTCDICYIIFMSILSHVAFCCCRVDTTTSHPYLRQ